MKILPLYSYSYNSYRQNFRSNQRFGLQKGQYFDTAEIYDGLVVNSHETSFFRNDINWQSFKNYLSSRFAKCHSVETFVYGCSDGSEPYSLSFLLNKKIKNPERFFPIRAIDIDESLIKEDIERKKSFEASCEPCYDSEKLMGILCDNVFIKDSLSKQNFDKTITNPVEFKCGNILEDIEKIDFQNPVLFMCRNMWPYIDYRNYDEFARTLYKKLPKGSSVIIGSFDYRGNYYYGSGGFPESLRKAGFTTADNGISNNSLKRLAFEKN